MPFPVSPILPTNPLVTPVSRIFPHGHYWWTEAYSHRQLRSDSCLKTSEAYAKAPQAWLHSYWCAHNSASSDAGIPPAAQSGPSSWRHIFEFGWARPLIACTCRSPCAGPAWMRWTFKAGSTGTACIALFGTAISIGCFSYSLLWIHNWSTLSNTKNKRNERRGKAVCC